MTQQNLSTTYLCAICFLVGVAIGSFAVDYKLEKKFKEKTLKNVSYVSVLSCLKTTQQFIELRLDERENLSCEEIEKDLLEDFK